MMMRRVYCGTTECVHDHVWENGVRFHHEPITEYQTKEQSMDPWQLPIGWTESKISGSAGRSTGPNINLVSEKERTQAPDVEQAFRRLALLTSITEAMKELGYQGLEISELLAVAHWVAPDGI